jgi:hypothetical protein
MVEPNLSQFCCRFMVIKLTCTMQKYPTQNTVCIFSNFYNYTIFVKKKAIINHNLENQSDIILHKSSLSLST